ncbi:hypothetical protein R84B8_02604 [Treponema sp. R8-4-B8]
MANKKFLLVIPAVMALVLGMTVIGCGDDGGDNVIIKPNNTISSVSISLYLGDNIPKVGNDLTASVLPISVSEVSYQWKRADSQSGTFTNISNATSRKYTPTTEDTGKYIKVEVTNSDTPAPVLSDAVGPVDANQVAKPTADPNGGSVVSGQEITLASTPASDIGITIRYTLDGTTPTSSSTQYIPTQKPKITSNCTLKAIAVKYGMVDSEVLSVTYTVVAAPSFSAVTSSASILNTGVYSVAYGNNRYVAGGNVKIAYSTNGTTWTDSTGVSSFIVYGITYGTQFVAVGTSGTINYSSDGASWSNVATTSFGTSIINDVAYGGGKYVAVGDSGKIAYSTNGTTWVAVTDSTFGTTDIKGITYGSGKFIAVGSSGKMASSTDGTTWAAVTTTTFTSTINGITYGGATGKEKYIAVGSSGISGYQIAYSDDGTTWTRVQSFYGSSGLMDKLSRVVWGDNKFVAVASKGVMYYSSDGTYWATIEGGTGTGKSQFDSAGTYSAINDIVYGGGKFLAVGIKNSSLTGAGSTGEMAISN